MKNFYEGSQYLFIYTLAIAIGWEFFLFLLLQRANPASISSFLNIFIKISWNRPRVLSFCQDNSMVAVSLSSPNFASSFLGRKLYSLFLVLACKILENILMVFFIQRLFLFFSLLLTAVIFRPIRESTRKLITYCNVSSGARCEVDTPYGGISFNINMNILNSCRYVRT